MDIEKTLTDLVQLPRKFDRGDASAYALLRDSGYFELHDQVTEGAIHRQLQKLPELVAEWLGFSEGKRASAGWFFRKGMKGYQVGYFPESRQNHQAAEYSDAAAACAAFIKREVEDIRNHGKQS